MLNIHTQQTNEDRVAYIKGILKRSQTVTWDEYNWYLNNRPVEPTIQFIQGLVPRKLSYEEPYA